VKAGEKAALVGASGCGKSTILKLIQGFYRCQSGEIRIDGELIDDWDIRCLRRHFGTVSQEPELFDETV
jgi:ABC-type multidrug transport system fused ATPase/permease subunit